MKNADWDKLSDREKDAKARKALWDYPIESYLHDGETYLREWRDGCWRNIPDLTTSYEGFGLVVEAMRAKGWQNIVFEYVYDHWWARFRKEDDARREIGYGDGRGDTLPATAALAAIRALEGKA